MIADETAELLEALLFTVRTIVESSAEDKRRITNAYREARSLVATMDLDDGSAQTRILACLEHFNSHKGDDNLTAAGWMLAAIQERVTERNLFGWRKLQEIVDAAVNELLLFEQAKLH